MNLTFPIKEYRISSPYGKRILNGKEQFHDGIDFVSLTNDKTVRAITDGIVCFDVDYYEEAKRWTDKRHSAGNYVIIKHNINDKLYYVRYIHLGINYCYEGQQVEKGEPVGVYADVGYSFGSHLHFDSYNSKWEKIDPSFMLKLMED